MYDTIQGCIFFNLHWAGSSCNLTKKKHKETSSFVGGVAGLNKETTDPLIDTPLFYGGDLRGKKQLEGLIHQWVGYLWTSPENGEDDEEFSARVKMAKHTWWFCNLEFKAYCSDWVQVGGSWYITPRIMRSQNLLFRKQLKRWIEYTYSNAI